MITKLNEIIQLLESIHETECDVEIDLNGSITFKVSKIKTEPTDKTEMKQFYKELEEIEEGFRLAV